MTESIKVRRQRRRKRQRQDHLGNSWGRMCSLQSSAHLVFTKPIYITSAPGGLGSIYKVELFGLTGIRTSKPKTAHRYINHSKGRIAYVCVRFEWTATSMAKKLFFQSYDEIYACRKKNMENVPGHLYSKVGSHLLVTFNFGKQYPRCCGAVIEIKGEYSALIRCTPIQYEEVSYESK